VNSIVDVGLKAAFSDSVENFLPPSGLGSFSTASMSMIIDSMHVFKGITEYFPDLILLGLYSNLNESIIPLVK
jgi:hypothetical protein